MQQDEWRDFLVQHARHPKRSGALASANGQGVCKNPLCGDNVKVAVKIEEEQIQDIRILPSGCSISIASASLMTDMVEGKDVIDVQELIKLVIHTLSSPLKEQWPSSLDYIRPLDRMRGNPTKIPCALIGWFALKDAIKNYKLASEI